MDRSRKSKKSQKSRRSRRSRKSKNNSVRQLTRVHDAERKLRKRLTVINRETRFNSENVNLMTRCSSYATRIISIMPKQYILTCTDNPLIVCKSIINQMYHSLIAYKEFYKEVSQYFKELFNGYARGIPLIKLLCDAIDIETVHTLPITNISQTFIAYNINSDNVLETFMSPLNQQITILVILSSYVEGFGFQVEHAFNIVLCGNHIFIASSWGTSRACTLEEFESRTGNDLNITNQNNYDIQTISVLPMTNMIERDTYMHFMGELIRPKTYPLSIEDSTTEQIYMSTLFGLTREQSALDVSTRPFRIDHIHLDLSDRNYARPRRKTKLSSRN
jgi:hypothetical protein